MSPSNSSLHDQAKERKQQAAQTDDAQLEAAIRGGMRQARQRRSDGWRKHWKALIGATAAIVLLIGTGAFLYDQHAPFAHTAAPADQQSPADLPDYVTQLYQQEMFKLSLQPAIQHGLYQSIHRSSGSEHYKLTIDGIVADSQRMIILYTAVDRTGQNAPQINNSEYTQLIDSEHNKSLPNIYNVELPATDSSTSHGALVFDYPDGQSIPHTLRLEADMYSGLNKQQTEQVQVDFTWNNRQLDDLKRTEVWNKTYTIQGYQVKLARITRTPLRTDAELEWVQQHNKTIESADVRLFSKDPDTSALTMLGIQGSNRYQEKGTTHFTLYYEGSYFAQDQRLSLQLERIKFQLAQPLPLVADVAQSKLLDSPTSDIQLSNVKKDAATGDMVVDLSVPTLPSGEWYELKINYEFRDAMNRSYTIKSQEQHVSSGRILYQLVLDGAANYKQPLTFTIDDYQGTFLYPTQPITDELN
ncbi:DUF4179 domain-containing protein [Paenibacillus kandeliae]|uniref:DUF4179 domain-containing protein n=1 Tax=Paenibacillus kandeliae TaxID=3231269 RepID=UPI003457DA27